MPVCRRPALTAKRNRREEMKIVLIGDSIRMGYQEMVRQKVGARAEVWGPAENCRHSLVHRESLTAWAIDTKPDVYHFNCGIHDLVPLDTAPRFEVAGYVRNLKLIVRRLKAETKARIIWATITPMLVPRDGVTPKSQSELDAGVARYNAAARPVMEKNGIEIDDLYQAVMDAGVQKCLSDDKCHMSPFGNEVLSDTVVRFIFG
jgi:hypothetical protein